MSLDRLGFGLVGDEFVNFLPNQIFELCPSKEIKSYIQCLPNTFQIGCGSPLLSDFLIEELLYRFICLVGVGQAAHGWPTSASNRSLSNTTLCRRSSVSSKYHARFRVSFNATNT